MTVATCEHDTDWGEDVLLKPESDSLAIDRGTLSAGTAPSDGGRVGVGGVEEGRLVGRKIEGRSAFIMECIGYREGNRNVGELVLGSIKFCYCYLPYVAKAVVAGNLSHRLEGGNAMKRLVEKLGGH